MTRSQIASERRTELARQNRETREAAADDLYEALKECSFRLGTLIAATGAFSEANERAIDQAIAALQKAEGRS